jgi:hypothetical protein
MILAYDVGLLQLVEYFDELDVRIVYAAPKLLCRIAEQALVSERKLAVGVKLNNVRLNNIA